MRPDGTFTVDRAKVRAGVEALTREIMTIQAEGDAAKAKELIATRAVIRPPVQKILDRLAAVPVDIEPRFTIVDARARADPYRRSPVSSITPSASATRRSSVRPGSPVRSST